MNNELVHIIAVELNHIQMYADQIEDAVQLHVLVSQYKDMVHFHC